ncbi:Hsp70 family protein [Kitasatospora sp. NPDC093806]|uniref:Hsp70 family protein n=1 Tax=Kitasatospora sp. NPDC093806 TaxID=3155075 RepID=UPI0034266830
MTEPVLVVDFGTSSSAAAVVLDGRERPLKEPSSGLLSWPSAVSVGPDGRLLVGSAAERRKRAEPDAYRTEFKRDLGERAPVVLGGRLFPAVSLVAAVLAEFRTQARAVIGRDVDRLVVTVPASYGPVDPRREAMLTAGAEAGFRSVELLAEPVAAAHATVAGEPFAPGQTVLVYDFGGGTFDTALVRIGPDGASHTVLGHAALDDCGGRDIDALLTGGIAADAREWLDPLMAAGATRARLELGDFVRRIKHQLSEAPEVEDYFTPVTPASRVARTRLDALIAPLLDRTVACCRQLLADHGVRAKDVDAVLLVGGTTRIPAVGALLADRLKRPLRLVEDPDLAVVHGAATWAARSADRRLLPTATEPDAVPLAWDLAAPAELTEWHVHPGTRYPAAAALGTLRTPEGALLELAAAAPGRVVRQLRAPGETVSAGEWLLAVEQEGGAGVAAGPAPVDIGSRGVRWYDWLAGAAGLIAIGGGFSNAAANKECVDWSSYHGYCYEHVGYGQELGNAAVLLLVVLAGAGLVALAWTGTRRFPLARLLALPAVVAAVVFGVLFSLSMSSDGWHFLTAGIWLLGLGLLWYFRRVTGRARRSGR